MAGRIHRGELLAAEIHYLPAETAMLRDPIADVLQIDVHQQLRRLAIGHGLPVLVGVRARS